MLTPTHACRGCVQALASMHDTLPRMRASCCMCAGPRCAPAWCARCHLLQHGGIEGPSLRRRLGASGCAAADEASPLQLLLPGQADHARRSGSHAAQRHAGLSRHGHAFGSHVLRVWTALAEAHRVGGGRWPEAQDDLTRTPHDDVCGAHTASIRPGRPVSQRAKDECAGTA